MISDDVALRAIQDPAALDRRAALEMFRALRKSWSRHTARGALVLAYVAPILLRKPRPGENPPEGWAETTYEKHLLPELVGTWWVPEESLPRCLACGVHPQEPGTLVKGAPS